MREKNKGKRLNYKNSKNKFMHKILSYLKKGKFRYITLLCMTILLLEVSVSAKCYAAKEPASVEEDIVEQQIKLSGVEKIEKEIEKYNTKEIDEILGGYDPGKIIEDMSSGKMSFNLKGIFARILNAFFKEVYQNLNILIKLIVLAALCAVLKNLQSSFLSDSVGELAFYVCYMVVVSVLLASFCTVMKLGRSIIESMVSFMQAIIPVFTTLLASSGNLVSGGLFQPILILVVEVAGTILKDVLIPLIFFSAILSILNNISDKVQLSKLSGFIKQISGWCIGIILTVFVAIISLQGSLGAVIDGVTSKTTKFAISAFVPVAGKYLADAADTVLGCTLLIKNAAGAAAMIGLMVICIIPILKMSAILILYRLTCALIEPFSEKRITGCINEIAGCLTHVIGIAVSVTLMFLVSITVIIGAGNISAMVR